MGAVEKSDNIRVRNKNGLNRLYKFSARNGYHQHINSSPFEMRARPPFPPGRLPPPNLRPPPPRMRMPPALFRNRAPPPPPPPPPPRMAMPPMGMRPRPRPPLMVPPPLMRPPAMMGPRRFPPPPPNMMMPNNKMRQLKNKIGNHNNKKNRRRNVQSQMDLSRPWVTAVIRAEYDIKEKLYLSAKTSNRSEDWDKFKEQRTKWEKMYKTAKLEYIGKHPEEIYEDENCENSDEENDSEYCEACDKSFTTLYQLNAHLQEHRECGIDGCKFNAHWKIVENHVNMQHVTGLFYKISQSNNPEDVEKWIAERKKRYPTKENIQKKQMELEEKMNRGERIPEPDERFGRRIKPNTPKNKRNQKQKKSNFKNKRSKLSHLRKGPPTEKEITKQTESAPTSLLDDKSNWNGNLPPFSGTSELYEKSTERKMEIDDSFDDNEWLEEEEDEDVKPNMDNGLQLLIGAYMTSDESENEAMEINNLKVVEQKEADNEPPKEEKILKETPKNLNMDEQKQTNSKNRKNRKRAKKEKKSENVNNKKQFPRKITLLERLLAPEIKHERNLILQCVRYIVQNRFFDKNPPQNEVTNKMEGISESTSELDDTNKIVNDNEINIQSIDSVKINVTENDTGGVCDKNVIETGSDIFPSSSNLSN